MNEERVYIATCGVCCSVCGLYLKGICLPRGSGLKRDEEVVNKKIEEQVENLGHVLFTASMCSWKGNRLLHEGLS